MQLKRHECRRSTACHPFTLCPYTIDCARQASWTAKTMKLLKKEPKTWAGFSFMPKGDITEGHSAVS